MSFKYYNPVRIDFDVDFENALCDLYHTELSNTKCLLVTSQGWIKRGMVDTIKAIFGKNIIQVLDSMSSNPEIGDLNRLKFEIIESYEAVIALGGGSVLDGAKFFALQASVSAQDGVLQVKNLSEYSAASDVEKPIQALHALYAKPIFALPTTAGTSSELTKWATIWDKDAQKKYSLNFECLYPKRAMYDISLMSSLPRDLTIHTALDSLSHAVESIWNKNANPLSTHYAKACIELILQYLPALSTNLDSRELRRNIVLASVYAGLAFSQTQTALAHALSYPITLKFNIPHGLACSFSLPILLECIVDSKADSILQPYKKGIKELFSVLQISCKARDYGLDYKQLDEIFASLNERAQNALLDVELVRERMRAEM